MGEVAFQSLRKTIGIVPEGWVRDRALARIARLDCANPDKALAPCNPAEASPAWGVTGFRAAATHEDYVKALVQALKWIICADNDDSIFVLRGVSRSGIYRSPLEAAGPEAPALIDFVMSPACPVSAKLTDDDKAPLQELKADALRG